MDCESDGLCDALNVAIAVLFARTRIPPRPTGPFFELAAFKELPYTLFLAGTFLIVWVVYFVYYSVCLQSFFGMPSNDICPVDPFLYAKTSQINSYATEIIHIPDSTSLDLLFIINGLGVLGRILPALIADHLLGPLNTYIPLSLMVGTLLYWWIDVRTFDSTIAFSVIYGTVAAGVQGMFPAALSSLTNDLRKMGVRVGMVLSIVAFACLAGPPLAGALMERDEESYLYAQIWGGMSLIVGALVVMAARIAGTGWEWRKKM